MAIFYDLKEDNNNPGLREGDDILGNIVQRIVELKEINSFLYLLEHTGTGAKHLHISNKDKENTFSVCFKTVPADSTGVAHILEHTVLCGSKKFPVRDPFFSMLKRSLSTFMNAFTAEDWTMYPFSTQVRKDFYNLMEVYLDATFFPKLDELSFKQEGHRLEIEEKGKEAAAPPFVYKGVVYNEMKGAMSSPDQVMVRSLSNAMYPSSPYRHNSGGDPLTIPDLTHDQLKAFHARHYHPSNAFFYTYGNLPLKGHLFFIHEKSLNFFKRVDPDTDVPQQPRWDKPRKAVYSYPIGQHEDSSKKSQVCGAWLTADVKDPFEILVLTLLEQILLGNSASPLRKALIDSELGTALSDGSGFSPGNRDTLFACGLKDVTPSAAEEIEVIIFDVLKNLVEKGIDGRLIESAIHQVEFHRKEITNHPYPYGIKLLLSFCGSWFHGGDPVRNLKLDDDLNRLQDELAKGPFFEDRIKMYFLENPHRLLFTLQPDPLMEEKEDEKIADRLQRIRGKMTPSDIEKVRKDAEDLIKRQEAEENISCLPTLDLEDVSPEIPMVKAPDMCDAIPAARYTQPTSGIFYFTAAAEIGGLKNELIPLVPFFCQAFSRIGTTIHDYSEMAQRIDLYTGGIGLSSHVRTRFDETGACIPFISFDGKSLIRSQKEMFEIIEEFLFQFIFSDLDRLKSLLLEYRTGLESMVVANGHKLAISLASRNFSPACALSETWHGIHQLKMVKQLTKDLSEVRLASISDDLLKIGKTVFVPDNVVMALIGEAQSLDAGSKILVNHKGLAGIGRKASVADGLKAPAIESEDEIPREGWSTSTAVSFVGQTFETVRMVHEDSPALSVISKILRSKYLHREIREKGGAYGGFAIYNTEDGLFSFSSYRDPHVVGTLDVFDKATDFIRSGDYTDEDIKEAILQVCSDLDKPEPPWLAAKKAFYRKIMSLSDKVREDFKKNLLLLTRHQIVKVAKKYFDQTKDRRGVAVISGEEKLMEANEKLKDHPLMLHEI